MLDKEVQRVAEKWSENFCTVREMHKDRSEQALSALLRHRKLTGTNSCKYLMLRQILQRYIFLGTQKDEHLAATGKF
jgi:hypothetical protein